MYLQYFNLDKLPFELTPQTDVYCQVPEQERTLQHVLADLKDSAGFIKITGEVGTGKTLLCHKLLSHLNQYGSFFPVYLANPNYTSYELRLALAQELAIETPESVSSHELDQELAEQLDNMFYSGQGIVLVIDEAQSMPQETMETLRLLTNLRSENDQQLQVVLFGQPELDEKLQENASRQLLQRITNTYQLGPLSYDELEDYLCYRLMKAGYKQGQAFTTKARKLLYRASQGLPRTVNILAHKALAVAAEKGEDKISAQSVESAINATSHIVEPAPKPRWPYYVAAACYVVGLLGVLNYFHFLSFIPSHVIN